MVSFTGSTRAGIEVARNAAPTVKRVAQELGGKSPNIVLDDSMFAQSVSRGTTGMMGNSGQTCTAPSRMLVPHARMEEAKAVGFDAVINVRLETSRLASTNGEGEGSAGIEMLAYGTGIRFDRDPSP